MFAIMLLAACFGRLNATEPKPPETFRAERRAEFASLPKPKGWNDSPAGRSLDAWIKFERASARLGDRQPASDRVLIRRIYLDAIGLLPEPETVEKFEVDSAPDKVEKLVDSLLSDSRGYAEHWMTFWSDLLRNDEQTSIDGLRKPISRWLYDALRENKPYDRMVTELLNPGAGGPDGFLRGVLWRGRVNLSQRPPLQAAQNAAQVFLATSIRCASCHDGFTTRWKLADSYALASFFAESPLEIARCEKPLGKFVPPKFLYADLGEVSTDADLPARRAAVAKMVTRPKNRRFAQVIVNRLWDKLLGRPIVEPLDELDDDERPALLDNLAYDFMLHDYDLKHMIRMIMTSRSYRETTARAKPVDEDAPRDYGPEPRRLSSEQFLDALATITGYWPSPSHRFDVPLEGPRIRAWRDKKPNALATVLGRPTREQVVTRRVQDPTVLQALEAVNGRTLADLLRSGAETLLKSPLGAEPDSARVLDVLFLRAYSRPCTAAERTLLSPLLGLPGDSFETRRAGFEDVLWMIVNSPEFQFSS